MTYDPKCWDVADAFLADEPRLATPEHTDKLAQRLQDTIEGYIEYELDNYDPSPYCSACGARSAAKCDCLPTDPMD